MTKKISLLLAFGLATVPAIFATSIPLAPGTGTPVLVPGATFPGTLVASETGAVLVNTLNPGESATVNEDVYRVAGGTLDFFYQFTNTSTGGDSFNTVAVRNFTGFTTAVSYLTGEGGTITPQNAPGANLASRASGGDTVNFFYQITGGDGAFPVGSTTDWVEVDTNATSYNNLGTAGVIDGGTAQVGGLYSPAAVPEPMTLGLLGGGLALLGLARLRAKRRQ